MTRGKSGAKAPDRNRWRAQRMRTPCRAAYEAMSHASKENNQNKKTAPVARSD